MTDHLTATQWKQYEQQRFLMLGYLLDDEALTGRCTSALLQITRYTLHLLRHQRHVVSQLFSTLHGL